DVRAATRRHRDAALRLLLGHALLDIGRNTGIAPIAVEPRVIHQIGGRPQHPFRILAVASVTIPGAGKDGLALINHFLGYPAREALRSRRPCGGEEAEGDEQAQPSAHFHRASSLSSVSE